MRHVIDLDTTEIDGEFDTLLDEMYMMYHYHQSRIPHYDLSNSEISEMSYYESIGTNLAEEKMTRSARRSKKVIFPSNPNFCNGLPRRR